MAQARAQHSSQQQLLEDVQAELERLRQQASAQAQDLEAAHTVAAQLAAAQAQLQQLKEQLQGQGGHRAVTEQGSNVPQQQHGTAQVNHNGGEHRLSGGAAEGGGVAQQQQQSADLGGQDNGEQQMSTGAAEGAEEGHEHQLQQDFAQEGENEGTQHAARAPEEEEEEEQEEEEDMDVEDSDDEASGASSAMDTGVEDSGEVLALAELLHAELACARAEAVCARHQLLQQEEELVALQGSSQAKAALLRQHWHAAQAEVASLAAQLHEHLQQQEDEAAGSAAAALQHQLAEAQQQLHEAHAHIDSQGEQLTEAQQQLLEAQASIDSQGAQLTQAQDKASALQQQLDDANARMLDAQQQLDDANARAADVQQQLDDANARAADAQQQLAETQGKAAVLQQQLEDANVRVLDAQQQLAEAHDKAAVLQQQLDDASARAADAQQQLAEASSRADALQQQQQSAHALSEHVQTRLQGAQTQAEGLQHLLEQQVQQHTNSAHAAASELSALHAALQALLHEGTTNPRGAARPSESAESEVVSETDAEIAALERELQLREGPSEAEAFQAQQQKQIERGAARIQQLQSALRTACAKLGSLQAVLLTSTDPSSHALSSSSMSNPPAGASKDVALVRPPYAVHGTGAGASGAPGATAEAVARAAALAAVLQELAEAVARGQGLACGDAGVLQAQQQGEKGDETDHGATEEGACVDAAAAGGAEQQQRRRKSRGDAASAQHLEQALASAQAQLNERSDELIIRSQRVKTLEQQLEEVEETHRQGMRKIRALEDEVEELNTRLIMWQHNQGHDPMLQNLPRTAGSSDLSPDKVEARELRLQLEQMATQLLAKQQRLEAAQAAADLAVEQLELKTRQLTPSAAQRPMQAATPTHLRPLVPRSSLSSQSLQSAKSIEGHPNGMARMSSDMRDLSVHERLSLNEGRAARVSNPLAHIEAQSLLDLDDPQDSDDLLLPVHSLNADLQQQQQQQQHFQQQGLEGVGHRVKLPSSTGEAEGSEAGSDLQFWGVHAKGHTSDSTRAMHYSYSNLTSPTGSLYSASHRRDRPLPSVGTQAVRTNQGSLSYCERELQRAHSRVVGLNAKLDGLEQARSPVQKRTSAKPSPSASAHQTPSKPSSITSVPSPGSAQRPGWGQRAPTYAHTPQNPLRSSATESLGAHSAASAEDTAKNSARNLGMYTPAHLRTNRPAPMVATTRAAILRRQATAARTPLTPGSLASLGAASGTTAGPTPPRSAAATPRSSISSAIPRASVHATSPRSSMAAARSSATPGEAKSSGYAAPHAQPSGISGAAAARGGASHLQQQRQQQQHRSPSLMPAATPTLKPASSPHKTHQEGMRKGDSTHRGSSASAEAQQDPSGAHAHATPTQAPRGSDPKAPADNGARKVRAGAVPVAPQLPVPSDYAAVAAAAFAAIRQGNSGQQLQQEEQPRMLPTSLPDSPTHPDSPGTLSPQSPSSPSAVGVRKGRDGREGDVRHSLWIKPHLHNARQGPSAGDLPPPLPISELLLPPTLEEDHDVPQQLAQQQQQQQQQQQRRISLLQLRRQQRTHPLLRPACQQLQQQMTAQHTALRPSSEAPFSGCLPQSSAAATPVCTLPKPAGAKLDQGAGPGGGSGRRLPRTLLHLLLLLLLLLHLYHPLLVCLSTCVRPSQCPLQQQHL